MPKQGLLVLQLLFFYSVCAVLSIVLTQRKFTCSIYIPSKEKPHQFSMFVLSPLSFRLLILSLRVDQYKMICGIECILVFSISEHSYPLPKKGGLIFVVPPIKWVVKFCSQVTVGHLINLCNLLDCILCSNQCFDSQTVYCFRSSDKMVIQFYVHFELWTFILNLYSLKTRHMKQDSSLAVFTNKSLFLDQKNYISITGVYPTNMCSKCIWSISITVQYTIQSIHSLVCTS